MTQRRTCEVLSPTVVIRTWNSAAYLRRTLDAVRVQRLPGFALVVVDSGSTDGTPALAEEYGALVVSLPHEVYTSGRALNLGLAAAASELVVLLSSDAPPASDTWLERLLAPLGDHEVAGAYGKQLPAAGCDPIQARDLRTIYGDKPRRQVEDSRFSFANAVIRRSVWRQARVREDLTCAEDHEWAHRVQGLGYALAYEPEAPVFHSHVESFGGVYARFRAEAEGLRTFHPETRTSLLSFLRDWQARTREDWRYLHRTGESCRWVLRAPVYRFFRSLGLHHGALQRPSQMP